MTKSQALEMIMMELRADIEEFMEIENKITSPVEYEDRVIEICRSLGSKLLRGGDVKRKGRNAKKNF